MNKKIKNLIFFSLSLLMIFELAFSNLLVAQAAPTFNESPVVLSGNGITFNGTPNRRIDWTSYDGYSLTAGVATSAGNADTVDSKHVGTLTNGKWCTTDGTTITCTANSPLMSFTETDPLVSAWAKAAAKPSYSFTEITSGSVSATTGYFSGNVGIGKSPVTNLDVVGSVSATGMVGGTGICIGSDCKVSWPAIIAAGGGNLWSGTTTGAIYSANSGNVGIGATNPGAKLEVNVGNVDGIKIKSSNSGFVRLYGDGTKVNWGLANDYNTGSTFEILSGALTNDPTTRRFAINGSNGDVLIPGNIGVGTTNPLTKLDVIGTIVAEKNSGGYVVGLGFNGNNPYLSYYAEAGITLGYTAVTGGVPSVNTMTLLNSGNVGISKTNPGTTLDVVGSGTFTGTVNGTGLCIGGDCKASWAAVGSASSGWTQNGNEVYKTNTAGNVGVGTTAPGAKLHINGGTGSLSTGLAFGDGDTGVNELIDDILDFKANSITSFYTSSGSTQSGNGSGWQLTNGAPTSVFPTLVPNRTDTDTGIGWASTNTLSLIAGGVNGLNVSSTGNVGVGTTAPRGLLDIANTGSNAELYLGTTSYPATNFILGHTRRLNYLDIMLGRNLGGVSGSDSYQTLYTHASAGYNGIEYKNGADIAFYATSGATTAGAVVTPTARIFVEGDNGNIGISKTNPGATLDVVGSGTFTGTVNGTGLCIGGDCKASWAAVGSASSGWTQNGAEVYKTNTVGNVGVGTTAPGYKLEVASGDISINALQTNSSYLRLFYDRTTFPSYSSYFAQTGAADLAGTRGLIINANAGQAVVNYGIGFAIDGANKMFIQGSSGNVGIGAVAPTSYFHGGTNKVLEIFNSGTATHSQSHLILGSGATTNVGSVGSITWVTPNSTSNKGVAYIGGVMTSSSVTNASGALTFATANAATPTERMRIDYTGNVGISKTNPGATLDVVGSGTFTGTVNGTGLCIGGDCKASWAAVGSASSGWTQNGNEVYKTNTSGNVGIGTTAPTTKLYVSGDVTATDYRFPGTGYITYDVNNTGTDYLVFRSYGAERMRINSAGNLIVNGSVGVGTTNPTTKIHSYLGSSGASAYQVANTALTLEGNARTTLQFLIAENQDSYIMWGTPSGGNRAYIGFQGGATSPANLMSIYSAGNYNFSGGNVGIGTPTPGAKLEVYNGDIKIAGATIENINFHETSDANPSFQIIHDGTGTGDTNLLKINVGSALTAKTGIVLAGSGNVGIGKTNPSVGLDVNGAINAGSTVNGTGLCIGGDCKTSWAAVGSASSGWTQNGNEVYKTATAGNVGIGVTAPTSKLDVNGRTFLRGDSYQLMIGGVTSSADYFVLRSGNAATTPAMPDDRMVWFQHNRISATNFRENFWLKDDAGSAQVSPLTLSYNTGVGNVGIGTTDPVTKLHIIGTSQNTLAVDSPAYPEITLRVGGVIKSYDSIVTTASGYMVGSQVGDRIIRSDSGNILISYSSGAPTLTVATTGRVGIGTTNPGLKGEVMGIFGFPATSGSSQTGIFRMSQSSGVGVLDFGHGNSASWLQAANSSNLATNYALLLNPNGGNVGIGKTNPAATLDIQGNGSFSSTVAGTGVCIGASCLTTWPWLRNSNNAYFNDTGNVGIGITNPTAKLHIVGGLILNRTAVGDTNYTALETDYIIAFTSLSVNRTLTLPNALCTPGRVFLISNETNSAYSVSVDPEGATLIVGMTNILLPAYNTTPVYCNGTNWYMY